MNSTCSGGEFGVALDIGTTVIKGSLADLSSGKEHARAGVANEQKAFGPDVITRLHLAARAGGLQELNKKVIAAVNTLLSKLRAQAPVDKKKMKKIIAVGNSAMYHLMLKIDPSSLARAPFLPAEKMSQERDAAAMGLDVDKGAVFKFLPNISGFVGSDLIAAVLASGMHRNEKYNILMDMGTNGEIALGRKGRIYVASCASGPAFEGRHIRCGMPALEGAIISARLKNKKFSFRTMGGVGPKGIAGSGLVDIVSSLLDDGAIDRKGRLKDKEFVIHSGAGKKIYITQEDVREVQLAKAAFAAGIEILRRKAAVSFKDLHRFYVTGTFGKGIDKKNAQYIGLVPRDVPPEKIAFLEDGALTGALEALLHPSREIEIDDIVAQCEHIELHKHKDFEDIYTGSMAF